MKPVHRDRGLVLPVLICTGAFVGVRPALAQSEAVTQFAPLEDSPVPTAPVAANPRPFTPASSIEAPAPVTANTAAVVPSDATVAQPNVSPTVAPNPTVSPAPTVGSSWLGATTTTAPAPYPAPKLAPEPAPAVVDSGLPVFVKAPSPARDDVTPEVLKDDDDETHRLAVTFSLARAFLLPAVVPKDVKNTALYEGTLELKVFERLSVAVLGGVGGFDIPLTQLGENVHVTGKELGGQARVYLLGDFDHGLMIGAEYLRLWAEADPITVEAVPPPPLPPGNGVLTGEATLTAMGAFLGYKITAGFGLTCDAKLGIQKLTADGKGTVSGEVGPGYPTLTESETFHYDQLVPLINVNVGWAI